LDNSDRACGTADAHELADQPGGPRLRLNEYDRRPIYLSQDTTVRVSIGAPCGIGRRSSGRALSGRRRDGPGAGYVPDRPLRPASLARMLDCSEAVSSGINEALVERYLTFRQHRRAGFAVDAPHVGGEVGCSGGENPT